MTNQPKKLKITDIGRQLTTSPELSMRMKALGVKQGESPFYWRNNPKIKCSGKNHPPENCPRRWEMFTRTDMFSMLNGQPPDTSNYFAAFTAGELGVYLPMELHHSDREYYFDSMRMHVQDNQLWILAYRPLTGKRIPLVSVDGATEAEARAKMLVALDEKQLLIFDEKYDR